MNSGTPNKKISPQMRLRELQNSPKSSGSQTPLRGGRFRLLPMISTPPLSHIKKVINPFEAALTERLHLPAICSPSLFHRPNTPPHSSTQFEWTMEQVSVLNPATIEAHETQFLDSPDPDVEARAQAAISTYFREQHVVPSPIECPMRLTKVLHCHDEDEGEPAVAGKRHGVTQTVLTLPPRLPKAVEDALAPFFTFTADQQQAPTEEKEKIDASLRRQLFGAPEGTEDEEEAEEEEEDAVVMPPPSGNWTETPENWGKNSEGEILIRLTIGALSRPICQSHPSNTFGSLSPIGKLSASGKQQKARSSTSSIYQSTPERLSTRSGSEYSVQMSPEETSPPRSSGDGRCIEMSLVCSEGDEEPMQLSQNDTLAIHETPMRCRSASRKNLSHSFSQIADTDEGVEFFGQRTDKQAVEIKDSVQVNFTRTDSGFNDGSCDTMDNKENLDPMARENFDQDVSMVISCTPAKW
uniref:Protein aurora borealis n=1 Tax=Phlebotomus papatasi TaxID=29031 RepID=A0A1B0DEL6_PHLPP